VATNGTAFLKHGPGLGVSLGPQVWDVAMKTDYASITPWGHECFRCSVQIVLSDQPID